MITIIGCGTLGSRVAPILKAYELVLIDHDAVKEENLPIQNYTKDEVGMLKAQALAQRCENARTHITFIDQTNIKLLKEAAIVIDCTDNLLSRRLISKYCSENGIPLVHGAAAGKTGIAALFVGRPDLEDLYAHKVSVDTCRSQGIDAQTADAVAKKQAELAKHYFSGDEQSRTYLISGTTKEEVRLSKHLRAERKTLPKKFYINWCEQAGCMSAKPVGKQQHEPREGTIDGVQYKLYASGEIHFPSEEDADVLLVTAKKILG